MAACEPDTGSGADIRDIRDISDISERGLETNGFRLNGFRLNGFRLNGYWLGASDDNNIKLSQAYFLDGPAITDAWLVGSDLHVETDAGDVLSGAQLGGAEFVFDVLEDGVLVQGLRTKIVSVAPLAEDSDVWLYDIAMQDEDEVWHPVCVDKDDAPTGAILLEDIWNPTTGDRVLPRPSGAITVACRGAALAKCVEWGYAPWRVHDGVSLADTHQACTRAVRADYCGDGTPHTVDGVQIHVQDPLGIQTEDPATPYVVEAEWGPDGALCLNAENTRMCSVDVACDLPACDDEFLEHGQLQTGKIVD